MTHRSRGTLRTTLALLTGLILLIGPSSLSAQDGGIDWSNTTELTYLMNGGNSVSSTLGFQNTLRRTSERGELRIDLRTVQTDATRTSRRAQGSPDNFQIIEDEETVRTAERYSAQARYDRTLTERVFGYGSAGWERNRFAGFTSRTVFSTGAGTQWSEENVYDLKIAAGLTYTVQDDVTPNPDTERGFAGLRATLDYARQLTESTEIALTWVTDANAQEPGKVRADLQQSVSASLSDRFALKTSLQLLLDNEPPLERLPLTDSSGEPTGETVLSPLGKVDHVISIALVVTL